MIEIKLSRCLPLLLIEDSGSEVNRLEPFSKTRVAMVISEHLQPNISCDVPCRLIARGPAFARQDHRIELLALRRLRGAEGP